MKRLPLCSAPCCQSLFLLAASALTVMLPLLCIEILLAPAKALTVTQSAAIIEPARGWEQLLVGTSGLRTQVELQETATSEPRTVNRPVTALPPQPRAAAASGPSRATQEPQEDDANLTSEAAANAVAPSASQDEPTQDDENSERQPRSWHEQTIYVPYEKLRETFERDGRGVFLTYEKFQELWQAAQAQTQPQPPRERPIGPVIQQIESRAEIGEAVVSVQAKLTIEIPPQGWSEVPLRLSNAAIRSAELDGQPARIVFTPQSGYKLIVENQTDQPQQQILELNYLKAFNKSPGQSVWSVQPPQATINRWEVVLPTAGMDVTLEPLLAATRERKNAGVEGEEEAAAEEALVAFVGAADQVRLQWNPKTEGAAGLEAFATVRAQQQLIIGDGVVRSVHRLDYDISRAALNKLSFTVPSDHKVINVYDRNVRRWEVVAEQDKQTVQVELFEPARAQQSIVVELEKFIEVGEGLEIEAPKVAAQNVGRQQGIVVARLESGLQGEATQRRGLLQMDARELPASLGEQAWDFAFRYGALPFQLRLSVRKVAPRIQVAELLRARLTAEAFELDWFARLDIQDAGVFQLQVDLPADYEIRNIVGSPLRGKATPAAVESFHRASESETRWVINLSQRAFGLTGLQVQLRRRLDDPNLKTPTGAVSTLSVGLPHVAAEGIEQVEGTLVLSAPETLRVNPAESSGLRSIGFGELFAWAPPQTAQSNLRPVLAFAYAGTTTELSVNASRREPYVTVEQLLTAEVESGVIRYRALFTYDIKYSGVDSLRIDLPQAVADRARNPNADLRQQPIEPAPDDVAEGDVAWSFTAESELLGQATVELEWEVKIDELGLGKSLDFEVPRLQPRGVDRATGKIALSKSESIDLYPLGQPVGLRPIDPKNDLPDALDAAQVAMAFEFVDQWTLPMRAVRYELQESKRSSIERAVVRIVVLSQGELSLQAIYRMRSAEQRLPVRLPEGAEFDAQPLRINGQSVTPERGADGIIFAPLAQQSLDDAFVLELRYSMPGTARELSLPTFPTEPAQQKVYLSAFLPPRTALISSSGPWTDVLGEMFFDGLSTDEEVDVRDQRELVAWVANMNSAAFNSALQFPVGQNEPYVFSTLRPADPPDGTLHLQTIPRYLLQTIMFAALALLALLLYGRSLRLQVSVIGIVLVMLLVTSVFLPRLVAALADPWLAIGIVAVAVLWFIGHFRRWASGAYRLLQPLNVATPARTAPVVISGDQANPESLSASDVSRDEANSGRDPTQPSPPAEKSSDADQAGEEDRS